MTLRGSTSTRKKAQDTNMNTSKTNAVIRLSRKTEVDHLLGHPLTGIGVNMKLGAREITAPMPHPLGLALGDVIGRCSVAFLVA
jgi:hypothetical protein